MLKTLLKFALAGPAIGGLVTLAFIAVAIVVPDLLADPANAFGRSRKAEFAGTLALVMLFSYLIGLFPALASGVAYHLMRKQICNHRTRSILVVCLAGVVAMTIEQSFLTGAASLFTLPVAAISAAMVSLYASRQCTQRMALTDKP